MDMLIYDQVAQRTRDINAQVEIFTMLGLSQWVIDTVDAVHIYKHAAVYNELGESFRAHLAFNYEILPGIEFELLELVQGKSWQVMDDGGRMSHYGYHLKRDQSDTGPDSLLEELQRLRTKGILTMQVSQTLLHKNTSRRYRYAYVTGDLTGGIPIKIIQRLLPMKVSEMDKSVLQGKEMFACLSQIT
jgi:hypothetical protein